MKSKPMESKPGSAEKQKANSYDFVELNNVSKSFDFVGLYKTAAETSKILEKRKLDTTNNDYPKAKGTGSGNPRRERSPYKNKKKIKQEPIEMAQINIDASSLNSGAGARSVNSGSQTATPNGSANSQTRRVKSIMKNTSFTDQSEDSPKLSVSPKPKKRNKSVSFMLDDNEEVVIKRTKSDDSIKVNKKTETAKPVKDRKKTIIKAKTYQQSEKENTTTNVNKQNMDVDSSPSPPQDRKPAKVPKFKKAEAEATTATQSVSLIQEKKKKFKKVKKPKAETMETESNDNEVPLETKNKKPKKKKKVAHTEKLEMGEGDGEPVSKSRKKEVKADIAEDLENLSIGDNAHTLTNLLDEMTVVDKEKRKKLRQKFNKNKRPKGPVKEESEKPGEVKEKVKWKKRKWNKDKKGDLDTENLSTTVMVENLPLKIMLTYKKLLTDHFTKYGLIKKIGIAEVYPTEESKPVFTTTITFYSDGAAEQALEENNTEFEGSRIRVKRPLPATATTIVVRGYTELTDQNVSSTFVAAGKIRSIRHLVKGKKSKSTAFVEFHGPEAVEAALKMAASVKIGGKSIHVAKFEPRTKKKKEKKPKSDGDSAADADSEDSND